MVMLSTRPASLEDDLFLFQVYADTRMSEVASWGWSDDQIQQFLRMQYDAQKRSYTMQSVSQREDIILYGEERIGRWLTREEDDVLTLVDISLLKGFRNQGIGTDLIRHFQQYAIDKIIPIELHVMYGNPAYRLYERMGFEVTGEIPPYLAMKWTP